MAESIGGSKTFQSKIPKYVRTQIPVCSLEYKNILRSVRQKETQITEIQDQIKTKKKGLADRKNSNFAKYFGSSSSVSMDRASEQSLKQSKIPVPDTSQRKVILTPGGTKRKVKPSYQAFKADLKTALECLICKEAESIVMVDDMVEKLNERFPGVNGFERTNVLRELSKIYGKKVEYMGKKKR